MRAWRAVAGLAGVLGASVLIFVLMFAVVPRLGMWRDGALQLIGILATVGSLALSDTVRKSD